MQPPHSPPPFTLPQTEVHTLHSAHVGRDFSIYVALPPGYADSSQAYRTLYMLDANWLFDMTAPIVRFLGLDGQIPPLVIVGIGYPGCWYDTPERNHDFVPPGWLDDPNAGGGAEAFLRFIRDELMPFVSSTYRVDAHERALWGDSLGGLFGLYVLLNHPATFSHYILGSPWIDRAEHPLFECERAYAASHADLPARVCVAAGALEFENILANISRLTTRLHSRSYPNLKLSTYTFEGESHVSVMPYNLSRGIRAVFG
jgi:predicted alpha/beta superfamily hydrolase